MLNQSISKKDIKNFGYRTYSKQNEILNYQSFIDDNHSIISRKLKEEDYSISPLKKIKVNGKDGVEFSSSSEEIIFKKINDCIKRLFKIKPSDRHSIVKQTISLSRDNQPIKIARLDIKEFYENIDRKKIVNYTINEYLLSYQNRKFLKSWCNSLNSMGINGLPRGMSLSSTLSEIYMRRFDNAMKNGCDVYYYARYVDDIIIFYTGEKEDLFKIINENLNKFTDKLELNPKKTDFYYLNNNSEKVINLDYLGYRIEIHPKNIDNEHKRIVKTYISDKKINKIKFRIRRSFSSYNRNRNFKILHSRLKFLSGNQYIIGDIERTKLKSGIYYNYPLITEKNQLKELDSFYRKFIKSKNPVITKSMNMIKNHKVTSGKSRFDILNSISFEFGYNLRVMNNFSNKIRKEIKRCW